MGHGDSAGTEPAFYTHARTHTHSQPETLAHRSAAVYAWRTEPGCPGTPGSSPHAGARARRPHARGRAVAARGTHARIRPVRALVASTRSMLNPGVLDLYSTVGTLHSIHVLI